MGITSPSMKKESFQDHLYHLIKERVGKILNTDFGPLPSIVSKSYSTYFNIGVKTLTYNIKMLLQNYFASPSFEVEIKKAVGKSFNQVIEKDIDSVLNRQSRDQVYDVVDRTVSNMLKSQALEQWVEDCVYNWVQGILKNRKSLDDIMPDSLKEFLIQSIESKTPELLQKFAEILQDPEIQDKLIKGIKKAIDSFAESLGPMGGMVQNFITLETIEKMLKQYLNEKEPEIQEWLQNEKFQNKVASSIIERFSNFLSRPLSEILDDEGKKFDVDSFCTTMSTQVCGFLQAEGATNLLSSMLRENLEMYIEGGSVSIEKIVVDLFGSEGVNTTRSWLQDESLALFTSQNSLQTISSVVEKIVESLLQKPIGKISNIVPVGVREGFYRSLQKMALAMLAVEVPGLVATLNIRTIVAEKVDSLDLLRLEGLLLSIMEEQFKYINLFGALLGFIIGCLNLLFLFVL